MNEKLKLVYTPGGIMYANKRHISTMYIITTCCNHLTLDEFLTWDCMPLANRGGDIYCGVALLL